MARLKSPEQAALEKAMRAIRNSSNYIGSLDNVIKVLELPDSTTSFEMEALLIHTTREQFGEGLDADMVLMALGLLKGFANPRNLSEERSGIELITERRRMFIEKSSYVADRHNHTIKRRTRHYESYEELEAAGENAIKVVINALGSEDGGNIDKVAQKLHNNRRIINDYLAESKQYLIYDEKKRIIDTKLQDLKCIQQKANDIPVKPTLSGMELSEDGIDHPTLNGIQQGEPAQALPEENTANDNDAISAKNVESDGTGVEDTIRGGNVEGGEIVPPQPDPSTNPLPVPPNPDPSKSKPKINIKDILLVITVSTICIALLKEIIVNNNAEEKNSSTTEAVEDARNLKAQKITILNKDNLQLNLGEKEYIAVETDPWNLNTHDFLYISSNPSVVAVKNINDGQVEAAKQLADGVENRSDIVVLDADSGIQDSITIFVDSLESRASEGKGGNNSSYDGEAQ